MSLGNIQHTSQRIKNERAAKMARSKDKRNRYNTLTAKSVDNLEFKKVSKIELERINEKFKRKIKGENIKNVVMAIVIFVITYLGFYFYFLQ